MIATEEGLEEYVNSNFATHYLAIHSTEFTFIDKDLSFII